MSAALKEKSAKVVQWLKTAEEESESEEVCHRTRPEIGELTFLQESDDDEIEFDAAAPKDEVKKVEPVTTAAPVEEVKAVEVVNEETGEAEEIDIDDI